MSERVRSVVARVFGLEPSCVSEDASTDSLVGWDSLRHLELMLALEREIGVRIPSDRMLELTSIARIDEFVDSL